MINNIIKNFDQFSVFENLILGQNILSSEDQEAADNIRIMLDMGLIDRDSYERVMSDFYNKKVKGMIPRYSAINSQIAALVPEVAKILQTDMYKKLVELGFEFRVAAPQLFFIWGNFQLVNPNYTRLIRVSGDSKIVYTLDAGYTRTIESIKRFDEAGNFFDEAMKFIIDELDLTDSQLRPKTVVNKEKQYLIKFDKTLKRIKQLASTYVPANIADLLFNQYLKSNKGPGLSSSDKLHLILSPYERYKYSNEYLTFFKKYIADGKLFLGLNIYSEFEKDIEDYIVSNNVSWVSSGTLSLPDADGEHKFEALKTAYLPYKELDKLMFNKRQAYSYDDGTFEEKIQTLRSLNHYPHAVRIWLLDIKKRTEKLAEENGNKLYVSLEHLIP